MLETCAVSVVPTQLEAPEFRCDFSGFSEPVDSGATSPSF